MLLLSEIEAKYDKMKMLRDELDLRKDRDTRGGGEEERPDHHADAAWATQEAPLTDIKNYYNDITLNNLALINSSRCRRGCLPAHTPARRHTWPSAAPD